MVLLLQLPVELLQDIISYLELYEKARLRQTNHCFHSLIGPITHQDLLVAETTVWAVSGNLFACKECTQLRHMLKFCDDMRKGKKVKGGSEAHTRFCVDCGIARRYQPGTKLAIMGTPYIICKICKKFTNRLGLDGACGICMPLPPSRRTNTDEFTEDLPVQYESDDDWNYSTRLLDGAEHPEEFFGIHTDF
jgi:hypothetical protein